MKSETGSKAGIQPEHANRLRRILSDAATCPANMNAPGYALHQLKGDLEGHWAVRVSGNWRHFSGDEASHPSTPSHLCTPETYLAFQVCGANGECLSRFASRP
ncbi:MAG: type II toxin-antitoxin system RelE/ParE family toxin [Candidatus Sulfotelmatobacter sp.]